ncbi:MAG: glycoside hydrolase family 15 protein [Patescibacteria group bacterium]|nr:glycoside hydrolase family 15 protein [Patescibacteria group bacterium]
MSRSIVLGNGQLLVCLDAQGIVRDLFYDHVGQENHVGGHRHHVGLWVDGAFRWLDDPSWRRTVRYETGTMVGLVTAVNDELGVELEFRDIVYNEKDLFIRRVAVRNRRDNDREARLFFAQEFQVSETTTANSAFYDPTDNVVVQYKGRRVFLINARCCNGAISDYAIGTAHHRGLEGTWRDAEDGVLSKNPVDHGSVDSVIGVSFRLPAKGESVVHYWIAAGHSLVEAREINQYCIERTPDHLLKTTGDFWRAWLDVYHFDFQGLPQSLADLFRTSLLVIRTHVDNRGAVIAAADSDFLQHGRDTYAYMWPRDGAFVAKALDSCGYFESTPEFFRFCNSVVMPGGYLMHKYNCDQSLGSSWHPWIGEGHAHLPIQEDETALVLMSLLNHYQQKHDLEFIESIYNSFIRPAANFLVEYRHEKTLLPRPSYDLWEERRAVHTFTCASVYGGLKAAAEFSRILGKDLREERYEKAAAEVKEGIIKYLYDEASGAFLKSVRWTEDGQMVRDATLDASSVFGVMEFGVLDSGDPRLASAWEATKSALWAPGPAGGLARYVGDVYFRDHEGAPSNPWFICTLWYAQYLIRRAKDEAGLADAREILTWVSSHALPSGVLSEQLNAVTGDQCSATPLTWSHAAFVQTMVDYLKRLKELGLCEECLPRR